MFRKSSKASAVVTPLDEQPASHRRRRLESDIERRLTASRKAGHRLSILCVRVQGDLSPDAERRILTALIEKLRADSSRRRSSTYLTAWPWSDGLALVRSQQQDLFAIYRSSKKLIKKLEGFLEGFEGMRTIKINVGIAMYPDDGNRAQSLLDHCYAACRRAGRWGGSGFCFSSKKAGKQVADRLKADLALLRAIRTDSLEFQMQPILDLRRTCMVGVNGAPIWDHPTLGVQFGDDVLRSVQQEEIVTAYNVWLAERICRQSIRSDRKRQNRRLGVRIGRSQLTKADLATTLSASLLDHGVSAEHLEVAVDGALLLDVKDHRMRAGLERLHDLGCQLAIVNVGMRGLPLEAFGRLRVSAVELAPETVSTIGRCQKSERLLKALLQFFRALEIRVRAIDVRSEEQRDFLTANDCDEMAGPLLAPYMREHDVEKLTRLPPCVHRSSPRLLPQPRPLQLH